MDTEILKAILLRALDQYDRAVRWVVTSVVFCGLLHLLIFVPYVTFDKRLAVVQRNLSLTKAVKAAFDGMDQKLRELDKIVRESFKSIRVDTLADLVNDFCYLRRELGSLESCPELRPEAKIASPNSKELMSLHRIGPAQIIVTSDDLKVIIEKLIKQAKGGDITAARILLDRMAEDVKAREGKTGAPYDGRGAPANSLGAPANVQGGFVGNTRAGPARSPLLYEDTKKKLKNSANSEERRSILIPIIEDQIIRPAFREMNDRWKTDVLTNFGKLVDMIKNELGDVLEQFPQADPEWKTMLNETDERKKKAENFRFSPPRDSTWWQTYTGKADTLNAMVSGAGEKLTGMIEGDISKIEMNMVSTLNVLIKQRDELADSIDDIERSFIKLQKEFDDLLPVSMTGFQLTVFVSKFPVFLGIVLATAMIWPANCWTRLMRTVNLITESDNEWLVWSSLESRTDFSIGVFAVRTRTNKSSKIIDLIVRCILGYLWIILAALELRGWHGVDGIQAVTLGFIGVCIVTVAQIYRWILLRDLQQSPAAT